MTERSDDVQRIPSGGAGPPVPTITVAVCTRDRANDLVATLDALSQLQYADLELLVVDNDPKTDQTERLVRERYPEMRYVVETRRGLNWARNRAVCEARGDVVAFTDDDAVPKPDWLAVLAGSFAAPDVMAATGLVVPLELETDAQLYFERYGGFGCGLQRIRFPEDRSRGSEGAFDPGMMAECGTGANMAFRRSVFDAIGLFDPALDVGTPTNGGGDIEMFYRIIKHGGTLVYDPEAIVRHRHRRAYEDLIGQIEGWGTGLVACITRIAEHYPEERAALMRLKRRVLRRQIVRYAESFVRDEGFPRELILTELKGMLAGTARYREAVREAEVIRESFVPQAGIDFADEASC